MLELLTADLGPGARGVFTTRAGGVSSDPYASGGNAGGLNLAFHVEDAEDRVIANRDLVDRHVGHHVAWMSQRHSTRVRVLTRAPGPGRTTTGEADSLVARRSGPGAPAVGVLVADCVPLLLATPSGSMVAAVHVGRQGLSAGVVGATLDVLAEHGAAVEDLHAALGPAICGSCYEVPADLRAEVAERVPAAHAETSWGTAALDIPAGVASQLTAAGVERIAAPPACTFEDERFYSYRRQGRTGRFAGIVQPV